MMRSRVTLATIDAAAIERDMESPRIIDLDGVAIPMLVTASISRKSIRHLIARIASRIASLVAGTIPSWSMRSAGTTPTPCALA